MKQSGFTLIELIISIAIIGILLKIGIPIYQNYLAKASYQEGLVQLMTYKNFYQQLIIEQNYTLPPNDGQYNIICAWSNDWNFTGQWRNPPNTTDLFYIDDDIILYGNNNSDFCRKNRPPLPISHGIFSSTRLPNHYDNAEWEIAHLRHPSGSEQIMMFIAPGANSPYGIRGGIYNASNPEPYDHLFVIGNVDPQTRQIHWKISEKSGCKKRPEGSIC